MTYDVLKLENQLCFPLYAVSKLTTRLYKPLLDPLGLTYTQYITLLALWEKDHVSVSSLGEALYLDSGTLTPLLKKLEKRGLVEKRRSKTDERTVIISLTKEGKALEDLAKDIPMKLASCMTISQEDARTLHRILHEILEKDDQACAAEKG